MAADGIDGLADQPPGGSPLHGLLDYERAALIELFEGWGGIDRSHRKLAHRGRGSAWCMSVSPRFVVFLQITGWF